MAVPSTCGHLLAAERFEPWLDEIHVAAASLKEAFVCGGIETCTQPVRIVYSGGDDPKMSKVLELPAQGADEAALKDLMGACIVADYGANPSGNPADRVLDPGYRKALRLDPDDFGLTLNLAEMDILGQIKTHLAPNAELRAMHYKLNVYRPGDFFKVHVDTLHNKYMVGSLLIVLPSIHEGGQLKVRHGERQHTIDWSIQALPSEPVVEWAAFYSDCKHEVHKVNSGVRITAVYYIVAIPTSPPNLKAIMMSPSSLALHNLMEHALADSAFCSGGGTICFKCQHLYPHEKAPTFLMTDNSLQLKGADACLVAIALGLGLSVDIRLRSEVDPHWNDDSHHTEDISQAYTKNGKESLGVRKMPMLGYIHLAILVAVPPAWQQRNLQYGYA